MFNFLHTFKPDPILLNLGSINIYWYGFFIVCAITAGLFITIKIAKHYHIEQEIILDLAFYLIIFGIIGARIYDCLLELPHYIKNPINVFKVWQGGLAIHGAIIGGLIAIYYFSKKNNFSFIKLSAIIAPGLVFGQAIGRWGNYFNQELFGLPTNQPWGIPINILKRPDQYTGNNYFHPTFLYESLGSLMIFFILIVAHKKLFNKIEPTNFKFIVALYFLLYSALRFGLEFIRIDYAPTLLGLRWPQFISLIIIIIALIFIKKLPKINDIKA
ncbi:MAG: prolipoprotein diacylglyceryl transferase [Candidatus Falkowbacteria bacterium]|nr:prolipoprotein diacylglyceryl transferase [Candidatus Falkowbacteria bacterium]